MRGARQLRDRSVLALLDRHRRRACCCSPRVTTTMLDPVRLSSSPAACGCGVARDHGDRLAPVRRGRASGSRSMRPGAGSRCRTSTPRSSPRARRTPRLEPHRSLTTPQPVDQAGGVTRRLVLASASPVRRPRAARGGLRARGDRERGRPRTTSPGPTARGGRRSSPSRKARVVADQLDGEPAIVLGCDTVLDVDGETRGKAPIARGGPSVVGIGRRPIGHAALRAVRDRHRHRPVRGRRGVDDRPLRAPDRARDGRLPGHGRAARGGRRVHHRRLRGAVRRPHRRRPRAPCSACRSRCCGGSSPRSTSRSPTCG